MNQPETSAWACLVLTSARESFDVGELIDAALFRGELKDHWQQFLLSVEGQRRGSEADAPDDAVLQEISEQFRTERDLISAEETEAWLEERGLTLYDFSEYFARRYWLGRTAEIGSLDQDYLTAPEELRGRFRVDLLLSGAFDRMASSLAWRIAAYEEAAPVEPPLASIELERVRFHERHGIDRSGVAHWLACLGRDEPWLNRMLALEAEFNQQSAAVTNDNAVARMMASLRLPLTRFVVEAMELDSLDAAREASLCVRVDESAMTEVAKTGGYPYSRFTLTFEQLEPAMQQALLGAGVGDLPEPFELNDGYKLCRLLEKLEPDVTNSGTRERLHQEIVQRHFNDLAAKHVRWVIPLASSR